jgi:hypothetical protein
VYTLLIDRLSPNERALVDQWRRNWLQPPDSTTMIYSGCNLLLMPEMAATKILEGIPIFGAPELCCGEPFYRMGYWDAARAVVRHMQAVFRRMPIKKLIFPCMACLHCFRHVYRDVFDVKFDFEMISMEEWILDLMDCGKLAVKPLGLRAVVHDNCWPRASGDFYFDLIRNLLERLGVTVVEPKHTREDALCCGMCALAARYRLGDAVRPAKRRLREFEEADADVAVNYCGGCDWLFAAVRRLGLSRRAKPIYHLLDLVRMAIGEPPCRKSLALGKSIVRVMGPRILAGYCDPRRIRIEHIMDQPVVRSNGCTSSSK